MMGRVSYYVCGTLDKKGSGFCQAKCLQAGRFDTLVAEYPLQPGEPGKSADKGGTINLLIPGRTISKNSGGIVPNSCLIEIEKWRA